VHEGGVRVCADKEGSVVFFTPRGRALAAAPPLPAAESSGPATLVRRNRSRGAVAHPWGLTPSYRRDLCIPWEIEARACEALDCDDDERSDDQRDSDQSVGGLGASSPSAIEQRDVGGPGVWLAAPLVPATI
jgi:hypothetical protein